MDKFYTDIDVMKIRNECLKKGYENGREESEKDIMELHNALKVCYASLCTYGKHPIVDTQVNKALELFKQWKERI